MSEKLKKSQKANDEAAVLEKIAAMSEPYRTMGKRLHELILKSVPDLKSRVWYGMPGYATSKSKPVLCFFQVDDEYMTFGLTEKVNLTPDKDAADQLMECAWFFTDLDDATEARLSEIVRKAVS